MDELRRILCVEDDADIRSIVEFSLVTLGGYEVRLCASGEQALIEVEAFQPQLVLLDVMMPGMTGPQTFHALRAMPGLPQMPVVFMTAKAMPNDMGSLLEHGATGVIVKPFDPVTLPKDILIYWQYGRPRPQP